MNNNFIDSLVKVEEALSTKVGNFNLFGAFQTEGEGLLDYWDIIVSFPATEEERKKKMAEIADYFQKNLELNYLITISRIQYLKPEENFIKVITDELKLNHSKQEIINDSLKRLGIKHAYVISSNQSKAA